MSFFTFSKIIGGFKLLFFVRFSAEKV